MADPRVTVAIDVDNKVPTYLSVREQARAQQVLQALPGITTEINVTSQARTVQGLLDALTTTGQHLQGLYDQIEALTKVQAQHDRDVAGLRRILGLPR